MGAALNTGRLFLTSATLAHRHLLDTRCGAKRHVDDAIRPGQQHVNGKRRARRQRQRGRNQNQGADLAECHHDGQNLAPAGNQALDLRQFGKCGIRAVSGKGSGHQSLLHAKRR
jgi:hypothetical protein